MIYRFALVGHVDYGKSTLAGHLLYLAGKYTSHDVAQAKHQADLNKMPRSKWSYILDIDVKERERGKTHEYDSIPFIYNSEEYELLDTPGHSSFVRSTIEAISKYDNIVGVLVVSAIQNEFESGFGHGMLKEQLILLRASGIKNLIICINKMDTINWNKDILHNIKTRLETFIKNLRFTKITYIGTSGYNGKMINNTTSLINILDEIKNFSNISQIIIENPIKYTSNHFKCNIRIVKILLQSDIHVLLI